MIDGKKLLAMLDELEKERLEEHMSLVLKDSSKTKFTVITGEIRMIREIRDRLATLK